MVKFNTEALSIIDRKQPVHVCSEPAGNECQEVIKSKEAYVGEAIRVLRKERGISQQELAKKSGVNRTTIARIETGVFKSLSIQNLEHVASALGLDLSTLLLKAESMGSSFIHRGNLNKVEFILDYPEEGFRISSLLPRRREFFFGKIEMNPRCTAPTRKLPHAEQIAIHSMEGRILLTRGGQDYLLKPGDCSGFSGMIHYELYNPSQIHSAVAFLVSYPSFV